jgi:hypothetical protein
VDFTESLQNDVADKEIQVDLQEQSVESLTLSCSSLALCETSFGRTLIRAGERERAGKEIGLQSSTREVGKNKGKQSSPIYPNY